MSKLSAGFSVLCLALYLGYSLLLIPVAADDIRMVDVFSVDESGAAAVVRHLYRAGTLELHTFSYGGLFYYVPLLALKLWGLLGNEVTDRTVILCMRGVCTAAGIGCLWMITRVGCAISGPVAGGVGAFLLLVTPMFLRWSVEIHPDLPQLFWLLCTLFYCCRLCRTFRLKWVLLASLFAGLAFGTKYSGLFLLPLIALATLLPVGENELSLRAGLRRLKERRYLTALALIPAVFLLTFTLTNPYAAIHFEAFKGDVEFEREHLSFGHMFRAERVGLEWLVAFANMTGQAHWVFFLLYVGVLGMAHVKKRLTFPADLGLLLIWIGGFSGYLILTANFQASRHLLPVLPAVLLFVAGCLPGGLGMGRTPLGRTSSRLPGGAPAPGLSFVGAPGRGCRTFSG